MSCLLYVEWLVGELNDRETAGGIGRVAINYAVRHEQVARPGHGLGTAGTGDRLAAELEYWRQTLAEAPAVLALPTDRPRPAVPNYAGGSHGFQCSQKVTGKLVQIGHEAGGTLFMVLLP